MVQRGGGGRLLWDSVARLIAAIDIVIVVMTIQGCYGKRSAGKKKDCVQSGVQQSKLFKGFDSVLHFFLNFTGLRVVFLKILRLILIPRGRRGISSN